MIILASNQASVNKQDAIGQNVMVDTYNLAGVSLIENQAQYKYLDMGQDTYMTLVIPKGKNVATDNYNMF